MMQWLDKSLRDTSLRKAAPEGMHEVSVALNRRAAAEHARSLVSKYGHVLLVAIAKLGFTWPVCEEDVRILIPSLKHQVLHQPIAFCYACGSYYPSSK